MSFICEKCGKEHDGSYGSGRFCSVSCANSRVHTVEERIRVSKKLKGRVTKLGGVPVKPKKCKICGREIINTTRRQKLCSDECRNLARLLPTLKNYFSFNVATLGTIKCFDELDRIKNELFNLYWVEHLSSSQLCEKYNYPNVGNITGKLFKHLGIPSKSCGECIKENYLYGRLTPPVCTIYKHGWHKTWDGRNVYLRSSYEFNYAEELDNKKVFYDVESLRIKYYNTQVNEYRCAIPDFYIPAENLIVEIKSEWTLDKQEMIDKLKTYRDLGYNAKVICDGNIIDL